MTMNGGASSASRSIRARIERRLETRLPRRARRVLDDALARARGRAGASSARSRSGWSATPPRCCPSWCGAARADVVTDQTSAHDPLERLRARRARRSSRRARCARPIPDDYVRRVGRSRWSCTCDAMLGSGARGRRRVRLRQQPARPGAGSRRRRRLRLSRASCPPTSGRSSARARGRSAGWRSRAIPADIAVTDEAVLELVPRRRAPRAAGSSWPRERVTFQGLPARICWLGYGERASAGLRLQRARARRARSRRRSSSAATTSTAARWPRPTARPRR